MRCGGVGRGNEVWGSREGKGGVGRGLGRGKE